MKITIDHSKTKRTIEGPFRICASREDLEWLIEKLQQGLTDDRWVYGWLEIPERVEIGSPLGTPPLGWDE